MRPTGSAYAAMSAGIRASAERSANPPGRMAAAGYGAGRRREAMGLGGGARLVIAIGGIPRSVSRQVRGWPGAVEAGTFGRVSRVAPV
jgi:hypothetical protein